MTPSLTPQLPHPPCSRNECFTSIFGRSSPIKHLCTDNIGCCNLRGDGISLAHPAAHGFQGGVGVAYALHSALPSDGYGAFEAVQSGHFLLSLRRGYAIVFDGENQW